MVVQEPSQPDLTDKSLQHTSLTNEADDTDAILPSVGMPPCKLEGSGPKIRRPSHCTMPKPRNSGDAPSELSCQGTDGKMTSEPLYEAQLKGGHGCVASMKTSQEFTSLSTCPIGFGLVDDELMASTAEAPSSFTSSADVKLEGDELTSSTGFVPISQGASLAGMPISLESLQKLQPVAEDDDQAVDDSAVPHMDSPAPSLVPMCALTVSMAEPVTSPQASSIVRPRPVSDAEVEAALNCNRQAKHSQIKQSLTSQKPKISHRTSSPRGCAAPTESSARRQVLISPRSVTPLRAVTPPRNLASGSHTSPSSFPAATCGKASRDDFRPPWRPSPGRSPSPDANRRGPEQHRSNCRACPQEANLASSSQAALRHEGLRHESRSETSIIKAAIQLKTAQRSATMKDLFRELEGKIDDARAWERGSRACKKTWSSAETDPASRTRPRSPTLAEKFAPVRAICKSRQEPIEAWKSSKLDKITTSTVHRKKP
eukprot:TRINITY_DN16063_c0_g1_i1.p1 TRINITY_DN16063_c0_g1~~TRINITY_DN16063_c0_g1_i1.p1  ORF type:complete len:486 (-),score=46.77 TRINITY_DN16063_c0_g1_i1:389-1846(-)